MKSTQQPHSSWINLAIASLILISLTATADSGTYAGVSMGGATLDADFDLGTLPGLPSSIDEDDTAVKLYAGYKLDLPGPTLGIELSYANFGEPEIATTGGAAVDEFNLETTALTLWGTAGIEVGPLDLYAKAGIVTWDSDADSGFEDVSDDGTDSAYGLGIATGLGPLEVRGELEIYDLGGADMTMISVGAAYWF